MSNKVLIIIIVVLLVIFFGGAYVIKKMQTPTITESPTNFTPLTTPTPTTSAANPTATPTQTAQTGSCTRDFDANKLKTATVNIHNRVVQLDVQNFGSIQIQLNDQDAPKTVENFLRLTNSGFYDCLTFHRVAQGFVIQGGDPSGDGSGGQTASGQPLVDELNPNTASYKTGYVTGVVAMAETSQPNTGTSQFFIMLADHTELPHNYPIFGKVISGIDVVQKIGQLQTNPTGDGAPVTPVVITKATIIK